MGDLDEIITTFPPFKTQTGKTKHNRTKQQQTNKNQKKKQSMGHSYRRGGQSLPTACTGPGQAGLGSCAKRPVPPTLSKPTLHSQTSFSQLEPFQGVSLSVAPHLLNSSLTPHTPQKAVCGCQAGGHEANFGKYPQVQGGAQSHSSRDNDSNPSLGSLLTQDWAARWRKGPKTSVS